MSIKALNWAFHLELHGPAKSVLIALAEHADQDGKCFPAISRLMLFSGLSERAVRGALRKLEDAGMLKTEQRDGHRSTYELTMNGNTTPAPRAPHPGTTCRGPRHDMPPSDIDTPAQCAAPPGTTCPPPRHDMPGTPAPRAPKPLVTIERKKERVERATSSRASRLPENWKPSDAGRQMAATLGLNPDAVLAKFTDHWRAKSGANATKMDWDATWRNWCRRDAEYRTRQPQGEFKNGFLELVRREGMPSLAEPTAENPVLAFLEICGNG
jgi:hypothetical protein